MILVMSQQFIDILKALSSSIYLIFLFIIINQYLEVKRNEIFLFVLGHSREYVFAVVVTVTSEVAGDSFFH